MDAVPIMVQAVMICPSNLKARDKQGGAERAVRAEKSVGLLLDVLERIKLRE